MGASKVTMGHQFSKIQSFGGIWGASGICQVLFFVGHLPQQLESLKLKKEHERPTEDKANILEFYTGGGRGSGRGAGGGG